MRCDPVVEVCQILHVLRDRVKGSVRQTGSLRVCDPSGSSGKAEHVDGAGWSWPVRRRAAAMSESPSRRNLLMARLRMPVMVRGTVPVRLVSRFRERCGYMRGAGGPRGRGIRLGDLLLAWSTPRGAGGGCVDQRGLRAQAGAKLQVGYGSVVSPVMLFRTCHVEVRVSSVVFVYFCCGAGLHL